MDLPFSGEELAAGVTLVAAVSAAFANLRSHLKALEAELRSQLRVARERDATHDVEIKALEADVAGLKESQLAVLLLKQTVASFERTAANLSEEGRMTRATMETMGRSLVRIETKMDMESAPRPGAN